ncbi:MAG: hypothetical protein KME03_16820 [Aphanocapsa lilacina HA4352-LM1]|jgi:hypothetical protein|nr:hypothetical protein [Aphanocapsa lilacina HA4352-LM1]
MGLIIEKRSVNPGVLAAAGAATVAGLLLGAALWNGNNNFGVQQVQKVSESAFVSRNGNRLAEMPEIVVTPECTFSRYHLDDWYYLFTGGRLVGRSPSPDPAVRRFCLTGHS